MKKPVLERLDASVNGVNRFISSNVKLRASFAEYQGRGPGVRFASAQEVLGTARELVDAIMRTVPQPRSSGAEGFIQGLREIMISDAVLLGAERIATQTIEKTTPLLLTLYREQKPLRFTLLGYPHKMPNPLYSISTGVDLGEIVSLMKLSAIMERIARIYPYGVGVQVLTENTIFYKMSDLSDQEQQRYFLDLCRWAKLVDPGQHLIVEDIVAYHTPELERAWSAVTEELAAKYRAGDPGTVDMVEAVLPTNFMTLNYRAFPREILVRLFDTACTDASIEALREERYQRALTESFTYLAYHQARYRLGFMESAFPNSLRLTVAPKVGSFGVRMLSRSAQLLPYYGYVVKKGNEFDFSYVADIPNSAVAVYQEGHLNYPMYYLA